MRPISFFLAAALAFAAETVQTPIDNDQVKVLNVTVQPHEKTRLHQHKINRVMVYLTAGHQDFTYPDKSKSVLNFKAGEMMWSPAGGMHIAEITSANPVNIIEIELKKPGAGKAVTTALDPIKVDKKHYKLEFENDQVRVFRVKIGPRETTPMHEHQLTRVMVYLGDATVRVTNADGKVETTTQKAGEIMEGGAAKHGEENLTDKPYEVLVTELKY
jgi:uncharacterized RmlC-like cupin family protein